MKQLLKIFLLSALALLVSCQNDISSTAKTGKTLKLKNHIDTVSYSLGVNIGQRLRQEGFNRINLRVMAYAISQVLNDVPPDSLQIHPRVAEQILKIYLYKERQRSPHITTTDWQQFMTKNALRKGVKVLPSGLQYEVLRSGNGRRPRLSDYVTVRYKGYLPDGTVFDDNYLRSPATFMVSKSLEGWQQALIRMREGDKWRIYLPPDLAFGDRQVGKIPPGSVVIYEIELLEVKQVR